MVYETMAAVNNMLQICENSGGLGAIFFHPWNEGMAALKAKAESNTSIPAVALRENPALKLAEFILHNTTNVTIGDTGDDDLEFTYSAYSGTSVAAPHITAAAALLFSHFPNCTNHQIRYVMAKTAYHPQIEGGGCDENLGHGVVQVLDAFNWLMTNETGGCDWEVPHISQGGCSTTNATLLLAD
jgi:subtilisin family serine protease